MSTYAARIGFTNNHDRPHVVWIEPWAEDFTLLPSESVEIHAWCKSELPWFHVDETKHHTQIDIQVLDLFNAGFEVIQNGRQLECGHQRQAAVDAGIQM
jgi:hypothetical protein